MLFILLYIHTYIYSEQDVSLAFKLTKGLHTLCWCYQDDNNTKVDQKRECQLDMTLLRQAKCLCVCMCFQQCKTTGFCRVVHQAHDLIVTGAQIFWCNVSWLCLLIFILSLDWTCVSQVCWSLKCCSRLLSPYRSVCVSVWVQGGCSEGRYNWFWILRISLWPQPVIDDPRLKDPTPTFSDSLSNTHSSLRITQFLPLASSQRWIACPNPLTRPSKSHEDRKVGV